MGKPPVLLLHGFGTSFAATWVGNGWAEILGEAGRQVIGVDMLGHGQAAKPTDPEAYRAVADEVLKELPNEPVDVVAFSYGARIALELAALYPERFHRLVVGGVGQNLFRHDAERRAAMIEAVRTGQAPDPELRYFANLPESPGAERLALVAFLERPVDQEMNEELLSKVTAPVLVALGDRDFAGPGQPLVDALPQGELKTLRGLDHFATPKDFGFLDAALTFLDAHPF
ncbi:MAG: alpha/beta hydrolase [Acidimicrobiales bacterium]|nr:alpha/beta hydrolase [Acidimicrobiales bacterium]